MIIASVPKNAREEIRIELTEYKGHNLVACRVWATKADGETVPTPKGITLKLDKLAPVLKALSDAEQEAKRQGLLSDG